jgi:hypothetical protein
MNTAQSIGWTESNQAFLLQEFATLHRRLGEEKPQEPEAHIQVTVPPAAIDTLAAIFELSRFEREVLLLCAGVEMDTVLAARCAEASGRPPHRSPVTFSLALAILSEPHWTALAPSAPLRRFRLIDMEPGYGVTSAPIRIDERILHYLAGVNQIDQRLEGILHHKSPPQWMAAEHRKLGMETNWPGVQPVPSSTVLHLCGDDADGEEDIAALIAHRAGRELFVLRLEDTPAGSAEIDQFIHLWMREALLLPAYLLLQWQADAPNVAARQLVQRLPTGLIIASRDPIRLSRAVEQYEVNKPDPSGQKRLWNQRLGSEASSLQAVIDEVSQQFRMSALAIASTATLVTTGVDGADPERVSAKLWNTCRSIARPPLEGLAERIFPASSWDDLVMPKMQKETLRQLAAQSRNRMTVYETWGFAAKGRRGLGLSALFAGPSGTGKTLAAEVLAGELQLDLYRIDLASVVSKYIGETEKNLKQIFDAADSGGVLLLFDEADALFGKRSEVKDSHDRYANIEVGYLLQRMESFQGLAILTTNLKSSLDKAFQRRLRFTIDFPFPDAAQREAIWSRVFPPQTPLRNLRMSRLAQLNMTGGNIRNIALNAAFLAADLGQPVEMAHVLRATRMEAVKIERPIAEVEIRGWV